MKRSPLFPLAILSLGLFIFSPGCGTDVGNSGKPITQEPSDLATVAGMQHDEVMSSVNEDDSDAGAAIALWGQDGATQLAAVESTCAENADGSALVKSVKTLALETEFGRPSQRKVQKDTLNSQLDITYSVPFAILNCQNNRPLISLAQLGKLKTQAQFNKSRKRSISLKADGRAIRESELTVASQRSVSFSVTASLDSSTVRRSTSFNSTLSLLRPTQDGVLTQQVQTLEAEPIVLAKTRTLGSGLTRVEIVSGAVTSVYNDAKKVVLRYRNLVLSLGSSCHPTSGSIEGQVFANSSATVAESSFSLVFDRDGATLIQDDGSEEDIELESCQF